MNLPSNIIPTVFESGARGERALDIYSLLLKNSFFKYLTWGNVLFNLYREEVMDSFRSSKIGSI